MDDAPPITSTAGLEGVIEAARSGGVIGLDTEFLRERTYRARLCLLQIATEEGVALIDPVAGVDVSPVAALLEEAAIEVVVHAGKQDLDIFHDACGVVPRNVFDVQVAAGFAGYGASLPYGRLAGAVLGVSLVKGESYTDWCRRPLTRAQLGYASDDVRYLLPMAERLRAKLERLGRAAWVADEMRALEDPSSYGVDPSVAWRKVAGRGALVGRAVSILRELAAWRELTAARRNVPRGWLVKDPTLIEIARRQPSSVGELKSIRGLNAKEAERSGGAILRAIAAGRRHGPVEDGSATLPRQALARARMMAGLADALLRSRCERAGIATELVATRAELEAVLAEVLSGSVDPAGHRLLRGWRRELAGDAVLELARGKIAMRASDDPPYVEEVPVSWPTTSNA